MSGLSVAIHELIRISFSSGMNAASDFGYLPSQQQADEEEISEAVQNIFEQAAQIADSHAERLKHTSHRDGLGMGWQEGENLCREIAAHIRESSTL